MVLDVLQGRAIGQFLKQRLDLLFCAHRDFQNSTVLSLRHKGQRLRAKGCLSVFMRVAVFRLPMFVRVLCRLVLFLFFLKDCRRA